MKPAIIAPIAFIVGVAGGTFVAKAPPPPAGEATDSSHVTAPAAEVHQGDSVVAPPATGAAQAGAHDTTVKEPVAPAPTSPAPTAFDATRLAQILDKMAPADVPPLVMQFNDDELVQILRKMSVTHSAAVIAALPKERAAIISKRLLAPGGAT